MSTNHFNRRASSLTLVAAAPALALAQQTGIADQQSPASGAALEEVVVTAQRREESLQRAALPVSALTSADLTGAGVTRVQDLTELVPAVQVAQAAGPYALFYLRGVGNFNGNSLSDSAVAVNLDGVYIARPSSTVGLFYDLDRMEILKGPQGTLYGRNATGGAINFITNKPKNEFEAEASLDLGNYNLVQANGVVNIPVGDRVAARLAVMSIDRHGYLSDGTDDDNGRAGRLQVRFALSDDLTINTSADFYHQGGRGPGATLMQGGVPGFLDGNPRIGLNDPRSSAVFERTLVFPAADFLGPPLEKALHFSPLPTHVFLNNDFWGLSAQADWRTAAGTLTVIPAYRHSKLDYESDSPSFLIAQQEADEQTSIEARFASDQNMPLSYLAGFYYLHEGITVGPTTFDQEFNAGWEQLTPKTDSYAAFGRLQYSISDNIRLTGGARWTRDDKSVAGTFNSAQSLCLPFLGWAANPVHVPPPPFCFGGVGQIVAPNPPIGINTSKSWSQVTWRGAAEWDVAPQSLLYASVETGFKAGGFYFTDDNPVYSPEKVTAYTLGSKNRFLHNRLQLNFEAFYWNYRDQQLSHVVTDSKGTVVFATQNVGKATIKGLEVEAQALATETTKVSADIQYLNSTYDSFRYTLPNFGSPPATSCSATPAGPLFNVDCSERTPPQSPHWTMNFALQQTVPLFNGASLIGEASTHFQTRTLVGLEFLPQEYQGSYWLTDLALGYHAAHDRWSLTAYVNNVADKTVMNIATPQPLVGEAIISTALRPPRTYGARAQVKF